jgi:hypothetical protein
MRILVYIMRGLHNVVGITAPKPEHENTVALLWLLVGVVMLMIVAGFGYFIMNSIVSTR